MLFGEGLCVATLLDDRRHINFELETRNRLLGKKEKIILIGSAIAAIALLATILSFSDVNFSLTDIPYFFLNQREITIDGEFVGCVPNNVAGICQAGFQSNEDEYFILTNIEELFENNPDLLTQEKDSARQFQISGIFTYGTTEGYGGSEAVGMIEVTSVTPS